MTTPFGPGAGKRPSSSREQPACEPSTEDNARRFGQDDNVVSTTGYGCRAMPRISPRALSIGERQAVLAVLLEDRFVDQAAAEVYATLFDEQRYLCSERTMYRVLEAKQRCVSGAPTIDLLECCSVPV